MYLTVYDYIIIITIYFVAHYIIFSFYNKGISEKSIKTIHTFVKKLGWNPRGIVKVKGLHRFFVENPNSFIKKGVFFTALLPREMPINWVVSKIYGREDILTFEANLYKAPVLQMEILSKFSKRWSKVVEDVPSGWTLKSFDGVDFYISIWEAEKFSYWAKKVFELLKIYKRIDCIDRISLRWDPPHLIVSFYVNKLGEKNLEKAFSFLEKLLNIVTAYKFKKKISG